jgi:hypothetical protein
MAEIEAVLMEYGYPANPHNAARAGFEAARRMLAAAAQRMLAASAKAAGPEREKAERDMYLFGTGFLVDGEHVDPSRIQVFYKSEPAGDERRHVEPVHPVDALKEVGGPVDPETESQMRAFCDAATFVVNGLPSALPPGWGVVKGNQDERLVVSSPDDGPGVVAVWPNRDGAPREAHVLYALAKALITPPPTTGRRVTYKPEKQTYPGHPCDYPGPVEPSDRMVTADFSDLELRVATAAEDRERGLLDLMLFGNRYGTAKPKIESVDFASLELRFNHEGWALLNEAWDFGQFADDFDVPLAKPIRAAIRQVLDETFDQAWAEFEAAGFRYGRDALEQVRFGFEIARGRRPEKKP